MTQETMLLDLLSQFANSLSQRIFACVLPLKLQWVVAENQWTWLLAGITQAFLMGKTCISDDKDLLD